VALIAKSTFTSVSATTSALSPQKLRDIDGVDGVEFGQWQLIEEEGGNNILLQR
jgi:hypothetical protein